MKKSCFYFMTHCFPHRKIRLLLLPLKLTVILSILSTFNALALDLGVTNTPAINDQQQKVTGTVRDAKTNEPLIGVNVSVLGTTVGAITDAAGNYSIILPGSAKTLVFTYVGYTTEKVQLQGQTTIDVVMTSEVLNLEEVVVIGYGTARKSDISGSVVSVDREDMLKKAPSNILQGLKGVAAGVMVTAQDGAPDANS
ncbi:MAG: carboxypeptidase-like regulatory domain-containing protein, partial [Bacteroidales bacterium]